ncbi:SigB/SigF/SigG family RNA polymerase sigma factor [Nocardioides renjunii]|uniref:SigB/SigF/SigG family RNA polymerase sigma factor n=1 Tax=Nocardioides renjunii TaxID=3095075 RepID=UPI002AFF979A|nr:SigB/SigF/SigG family RNA polymerase sigma factor [Nocardioides sp. S-34]WQQ23978.1 SigB/SigF/SigG family RNA polymerase sigma factor [Nocardioides sp. S-34]
MVSVSVVPEHPVHAMAPTGRSERQHRTESIVSHLRLVEPSSSDSLDLTRQLIESNTRVARSIASRYKNRGIDLDDLEQVALLGLTKAAHRFDPTAGHDFMAFAVPTIRGEIRRWFRDHGWTIRPPRRVQELQARIMKAQGELEQALGRSPRPSEIAAHLGEDLDAVVEALSADGFFTPTSLDAAVGDGSSGLADLLGEEDPAMRSAEARAVLEPLLAALSDRDRSVLRLRFYEQRTQQEIAEAFGITQAQVSRILARILAELRARLADPGADPAAGPPAGQAPGGCSTRCVTYASPVTRAG